MGLDAVRPAQCFLMEAGAGWCNNTKDTMKKCLPDIRRFLLMTWVKFLRLFDLYGFTNTGYGMQESFFYDLCNVTSRRANLRHDIFMTILFDFTSNRDYLRYEFEICARN